MASYRLILALVLVMCVACQQTAPLPKPPASAKALASEDGLDSTRVDLVIVDLRRTLADRGFRDVAVESYEVPATMSWADVLAYYTASVGTPWERAEDMPTIGWRYQMQTWRSPGRLFGQSQVFAIAFIDKPQPGQELPFRVLLQAHSKSTDP